MSITVTCYGETETFKSKEAVIKRFNTCARCSEGSERDRYLSIIWQAQDGLTEIYDTNPDYLY